VTEEQEKIIKSILADPDLTQNGKANALIAWIDSHDPAPTEKIAHWQGMYEPKTCGVYWTITNRGVVAECINIFQSATDMQRVLGICCETKKEAELVKSHLEARLEVINLLRKLNDGWTPDWDDSSQVKWSPKIDYGKGKIIFCTFVSRQVIADYFQAKAEVWERVIEELGEEKVLLALWPKYGDRHV